MVPGQAGPIVVEKLEQGQQPGFQPAGRHRQEALFVERHRNRRRIVERPHHRQQLRLFAQQAQQRWHQTDPLAVDQHAQIEIEPLAADFLLDADEPLVGLGQPIGKIVRHGHGDAGPFQFIETALEQRQPAGRIRTARQQTVIAGVEPPETGQPSRMAFQTEGLQPLPHRPFAGQIALQCLRPAVGQGSPQQGCRTLGTAHADALGIIEKHHGNRVSIFQTGDREMAEAATGQNQTRLRGRGGDDLRGFRQRNFNLLPRGQMARQGRIGFVERRRGQEFFQYRSGQFGLQFADLSGRDIEVKQRPAAKRLQLRRQIEPELLQAGRGTPPV